MISQKVNLDVCHVSVLFCHVYNCNHQGNHKLHSLVHISQVTVVFKLFVLQRVDILQLMVDAHMSGEGNDVASDIPELAGEEKSVSHKTELTDGELMAQVQYGRDCSVNMYPHESLCCRFEEMSH